MHSAADDVPVSLVQELVDACSFDESWRCGSNVLRVITVIVFPVSAYYHWQRHPRLLTAGKNGADYSRISRCFILYESLPKNLDTQIAAPLALVKKGKSSLRDTQLERNRAFNKTGLRYFDYI